jgi:hypothetical protein
VDAYVRGKREGESVPTSTPRAGGPQNVSTGPTVPQRPKTCNYWFVEAVPNPNHQRTFPYADLAERAHDGDEIGYTCRYSDTGEFAEQNTFIYGRQTPPGAPATDNLARARALLDLSVEQWFPIPTATGMPGLTNQRVGIATWLAVPGLAVPPTRGDPALMLHVRISKATFTVPVRAGAGVETFDCDRAGIGGDGRPDGNCSHRFHSATAGTVPARIEIGYTVTMSSDVTGEAGTFVGVVNRQGLVDMNVKDLQATAS